MATLCDDTSYNHLVERNDLQAYDPVIERLREQPVQSAPLA
ncbi:MAG: hypothetical protein QGG09_16485 [Pirellulaceae bacterium]|nr:hypothetical protein [Pirellulaceae bacterium]HJN13131.1 hypothetical protein [Pirellulaceae bacterium]